MRNCQANNTGVFAFDVSTSFSPKESICLKVDT